MPDVQSIAYPGRIFIGEAVRVTMRREASRFRLRETGGILLGYRSGSDIVVTGATGPGPNARHQRNSFEPDGSYCQSQLTAAYQSTGGVISYLGEWHTHPCAGTSPSRQDLRSMLTIANDPEYHQPEPALCIYRRDDKFLKWRWSEELALFVVNRAAKAWQTAFILWH
jgi:integrative and conjugative element protein (TIGR02256 family)